MDMSLPPSHAILVVDAKGFSGRPSAHQAELNAAIEQVLELAFRRSCPPEVWRERRFAAHTGDGYMAGFPPDSLALLVDPLLARLQEVLAERHRQHLDGVPPLRLRAALNAGPLPNRGQAGDGVGAPMTRTHRLVDSERVRRELQESDEEVTFVVGILSARVFEDVVQAGYTRLRQSQFEEVTAVAKDFSERAYLYVPQPSRRAAGPAATPAQTSGGDVVAARPPPGAVVIEQHGDRNVVGAFASGHRARASSTVNVGSGSAGDPRRVAALLDRMLESIESHRAQLPEADRARNAVHSMRDEIDSSEPDPNVLRRMLVRLQASVRHVSSFAGSLADIADALRPWLP
jgi:hypothetical protein